MNIRSIDLQVLIPRVTEVSKTQQTVSNQNSLEQQHFSEEWRQISTQRQHQIQNTSQTQEGVITERDSEGNNQKKRQHKQRQGKKRADLDSSEPYDRIRGSIIDIKL